MECRAMVGDSGLDGSKGTNSFKFIPRESCNLNFNGLKWEFYKKKLQKNLFGRVHYRKLRKCAGLADAGYTKVSSNS